MEFAADAMLGKLARWLRILGFDTFYRSDVEDSELLRVAREEGRVLLTRDTRVAQRRALPPMLLIRDDGWRDQLAQVFRELNLTIPDTLFTRCLECNVPLRQIERSAAKFRVPGHVFETHQAFRECPRCARIFWRGSHYEHAAAVVSGCLATAVREGAEQQQ